jgi:hypothetical protein
LSFNRAFLKGPVGGLASTVAGGKPLLVENNNEDNEELPPNCLEIVLIGGKDLPAKDKDMLGR